MNRYPDTDVDAVRADAHLETVAAEHLTLLPAGSGRLKALCPFHDEKTPSFVITTATNTWHCFGACSTGGDVISFTRDLLHLGFREALELLADQFRIPLHPQAGAAPEPNPQRPRLLAALTDAQTYFAEQLTTPAGRIAREHLQARGFDDTIATTTGCGYAPPDPGQLIRHLTGRGHTLEDLTAAGLLAANAKPPRAFFRGRLTFPITDPLGQAIAFGARRIDPDDPIQAKYLNSAESPLYRKTETLYGLAAARRAIVRQRRALIVEGYTDVMACIAAGIDVTVATCGVALTPHQVATLRRAIGPEGELVFGFDADTAGLKAARHNYSVAKGNIRLSALATPPDGRDPADVRLELGDQALSRLFTDRKPLLESLIDSIVHTTPTTTPEDRIVALDLITKTLLDDIPDLLLRREYAARAARLLGFDPRQVTQRLRQPATTPAPLPAQPTLTPQQRTQHEALLVCVHAPEAARMHLPVLRGLLTSRSSIAIATAIQAALASQGIWTEQLLQHCATPDTHAQMTALLTDTPPCDEQAAGSYLVELIMRLDEQRERQQRQALRQQLSTAATPEQKRAVLELLTQA